MLGVWRWLDWSVAAAFASAAGPGGLVERPVVCGLSEVHLPWFGEAALGVPGVQDDEVVPDECDGHEHGGRDEAGLSEEAAVDAEPLVAVGADKTLDEGAPVEGEPSGWTARGGAAGLARARCRGR